MAALFYRAPDRSKRRWSGRILRGILLAVGLLACFVPLVGQMQADLVGHSRLESVLEEARQSDTATLDAALARAQAWNERLGGQDHVTKPDGQSAGYEQQLAWMEEGMMGILRIEAIGLELPILHDATEESLKNGAGHLDWSSLPCGGKGTHCVLSSHRGMASASLFTRLDELQVGDRIAIENPKQSLAYVIDSVETVLPEETESLQIDPEEDLLSLVTCTPYGLNTHRLLVHAKRTDTVAIAPAAGSHGVFEASRLSVRGLLFTLLPFGLLALVLVVLACRHIRSKERKRKRKQLRAQSHALVMQRGRYL